MTECGTSPLPALCGTGEALSGEDQNSLGLRAHGADHARPLPPPPGIAGGADGGVVPLASGKGTREPSRPILSGTGEGACAVQDRRPLPPPPGVAPFGMLHLLLLNASTWTVENAPFSFPHAFDWDRVLAQERFWDAIALGHLANATSALAAGASVDEGDAWDEGCGALHTAAKAGDATTLAWLLLQNPQVDRCCSRGETSLHLAASRGDVAVIQHLLDAGANPRLLDARGDCPADRARRLGHRQAAFLLRRAHGSPPRRKRPPAPQAGP
ncbi:ankyrin repeat-containing domain protein [Baffinella frigidus]|nr:ankyrin repeat-containing domain protein [Cryptophyta sp. CCMP2293]